MPTKTKSKPDPNAVYQCRDSISFDLQTTLRAGERRRGDDPLVREHFEHWVPDGTPIRPAQLTRRPGRGCNRSRRGRLRGTENPRCPRDP